MSYDAVVTAVRAYAQVRAHELLKEQPFNVPELEVIILDELRAGVRLGVSDCTMPLQATGHLRPNEQMRLKL